MVTLSLGLKMKREFSVLEKKMNMLFVNWCLVTSDKLEKLEYFVSLNPR